MLNDNNQCVYSDLFAVMERMGEMNNPGRLLLGIGLVAGGILFLLDVEDYVDAGSIIESWWPLIVIAFGVTALFGPSRSLIGGGIIIILGLLLLTASLELLPVTAGELFLPLLLIAVGIGVLLMRSGVTASGDAGDRINGFAIFGGQTTVARSESFSGGSLTALFGGIDLDLRQAHLAPDGAGIETFSAFGGINVIVPRGWRVTVTGMPLFAAYEDSVDRSVEPEPGAPQLVVSGVALFGGVEVKHDAS
ncbi:MAG: LiaF domain-containing protein [Thermomicrobiaceae bacterium]